MGLEDYDYNIRMEYLKIILKLKQIEKIETMVQEMIKGGKHYRMKKGLIESCFAS